MFIMIILVIVYLYYFIASTIKFRSSLHYLNIEVIFNKFLSLFNRNPPKYKYVLDFENVKFMDITSVNMFADIIKLFYSKKIPLSFSHMNKDITEFLKSFDIPVIVYLYFII